MDQPDKQTSREAEIEQLTAASYFKEVARGIGVTLGLSLLWALEIGRDAFFWFLNWMNLRPRRHKRASAFPPGRPRKRKVA